MKIWRRKFLGAALACLLAIAVPLAPAVASGSDTLVFAAASLTDALTTIAKNYEAETGRKVTLSFAGSSVLARQIEAGSPADLFISADEAWMDELSKRDLITPGSRSDLLANRLVLIAPKASTSALKIAPDFPLLKVLDGGRLAVADPQGVPAGRYAKAALTSLDVWSSVEDHLAVAQNVRVALAYVARGEAPFGIVYETDAMSEPNVRVVDAFPASSHPPIVYPVALTKGAGEGAKDFLAYLKGDKARAIFSKTGFSRPGTGE